MNGTMVVAVARPLPGARQPAGKRGAAAARTAGVDPPPQRDGVVVAAERELRHLSRRITALNSRAGMLRAQRDHILDWLLREAVRLGHPAVRNLPPDGRRSCCSPLKSH